MGIRLFHSAENHTIATNIAQQSILLNAHVHDVILHGPLGSDKKLQTPTIYKDIKFYYMHLHKLCSYN